MTKRLTNKQIEERTIVKILKRINTIEIEYGIELTVKTCTKYSNLRKEESKLNREIIESKKQLERLMGKKKWKR